MRTFSLTQAESLLPLIRREMESLQPVYRQLRKRFSEIARDHSLPIDDPKVRDFCMADDRIRDLFMQVEESLCLFHELGVECKGIEQGLFDFPCLVEDRIVFLCWQLEENSISHWHEVDENFEKRQPLFEAYRLGYPLEQRLPN